MKLLAIAIGFSIGNFLWAAIVNQNWGEASKISFMQASAIAYIWFFKVTA